MNYIPFYCLLGFAIIVTALFLIWRDPKKPAFNSLLKGISSFAFMVLALVCAFMNDTLTLPVLFILIGLTSSIFGDLFLAGKDFKGPNEDGALFAGFGSFCITQLMYLLGLIFLYGFTWWAFLIGGVLTLGLILSEKMLKLNFDKFRIIVAIYSILLMTVLGQGIMSLAFNGYTLAGLLFMLGVIFFALSDLILSFIYFRKDTKDIVYTFNLLTYYIGQILIASAIMFI